jgi:CheY-like chemotaxis protein/two-component sensor histidine kinase
VLDFSKIEADSLEINAEAVNPKNLLGNVTQQFRQEAEKKGLELSMDGLDNLPTKVSIDPVRTSQVLFNLIGNAIKYTDKGSVKIDVNSTFHKLDIIVSDTGRGIGATEQSKVFTPFEQLQIKGQKKQEGAGLGLSISKRLATLMGGDIRFSSTEGKGSVFRFSVPFSEVKEGDSEQTKHVENRAAVDRELNVLVAEDHAANQLLMNAMLTQRGHVCTIVENGQLAVEAVKKEQFDLVLMDMMMPEMDGVEATREIRQFLSKSDLPIIALTANVSLEDREACLKSGMNDFLTKPLNGEALDKTLERWSRV